MRISLLRKIYPSLDNGMKNIKWRKLTDKELDLSMNQYQVIANCYDEAVRFSLLNTKQGREMIKSRIKIERDAVIDPSYKTKLNIKGKEEVYRATKADYYGKGICADIYNNYRYADGYIRPPRLSIGVSCAIQKMINKHPSMKPFSSKIYMLGLIKNRACEFNKPSNAFRWFTGKEPIAIGEKGINISLKKHKDEVKTLLQELSETSCDDYSFVAVSGYKKYKDIHRWHCLPIIGINKETQELKLLDKHDFSETDVPFDEFIKNFKAIVGVKHK